MLPVKLDRFKLAHHFSKGNELDIEDEGCVGRNNAWDATSAVCVVRRASKDSLLAHLELSDALVPATNNLADADHEFEGLTTGH